MTWHKPLSVRSTRGSIGALLAGAGLLAMAVACSVTTNPDGEPPGGVPSTGGMGGDGSGGTSTSTGGDNAGGDDNGSGGDQNGNGEVQLDCHEDDTVKGTLASTAPDDDGECWACIKEECPDEFAECHAIEPHSVCGYDDAGAVAGEIDCIFECFDELASGDDPIFSGIQEDIDDCAAECKGTAACGTTTPSSVTIQLAACAIGLQGGNGCQVACGWQEEEP